MVENVENNISRRDLLREAVLMSSIAGLRINRGILEKARNFRNRTKEPLIKLIGELVLLISSEGNSEGKVLYGANHPMLPATESFLNYEQFEDERNKNPIGWIFNKLDFYFVSNKHPGLKLQLYEVKVSKNDIVKVKAYDPDMISNNKFDVTLKKI